MKSKLLSIAAALIVAVVLYLLLWPVPIEPVAWEAPVDRGLVDPYAPNDLLGTARAIDLGHFAGPEDAALGHDGAVYVTTQSGHVVRVHDGSATEFAFTGGRPLGIETDVDGSFVIANSRIGLQRVGSDGSVELLYGGPDVDLFANNLAIGTDGTVFFTEATRKFGSSGIGDTMDATVLDVLEHGGHGRLLRYDPKTDRAEVLLDGLAYANGVAISESGDFLVVVEMNEYRILKYWLAGPDRGTSDVLIDNLPGFGDNLKSGRAGRFWLGFAAPRKPIVDTLAGRPWLRKLILRLPKFLHPEADVASHVIAFNGDGDVLMNLQDPAARYPTLTGVLETQHNLYLTTLYGNVLPVVAKQDLR